MSCKLFYAHRAPQPREPFPLESPSKWKLTAWEWGFYLTGPRSLLDEDWLGCAESRMLRFNVSQRIGAVIRTAEAAQTHNPIMRFPAVNLKCRVDSSL